MEHLLALVSLVSSIVVVGFFVSSITVHNKKSHFKSTYAFKGQRRIFLKPLAIV